MRIFLDNDTDRFRLVYRPEALAQGTTDDEVEGGDTVLELLVGTSSPDRSVANESQTGKFAHPKYPEMVWED